MDRLTVDKLNLGPRTDEELQGVLTSFEQKWQDKARRQMRTQHRAM